jgi:hypothetical protein
MVRSPYAMTPGMPLAGRVRELESVTQHLTGGSGSAALLVVGEAGVGKSRLISAAIEQAERHGVLVLPGWCLAMGDGLPLLPVIEMLHALARADSGELLNVALKECPSYVRSEIARLLPELEADAPQAAPFGPASGGDARWRQYRLFEAVRRLFSDVADQRPVAAAVEDLHWADETTLDVLDFLLLPSGTANLPLVVGEAGIGKSPRCGSRRRGDRPGVTHVPRDRGNESVHYRRARRAARPLSAKGRAARCLCEPQPRARHHAPLVASFQCRDRFLRRVLVRTPRRNWSASRCWR